MPSHSHERPSPETGLLTSMPYTRLHATQHPATPAHCGCFGRGSLWTAHLWQWQAEEDPNLKFLNHLRIKFRMQHVCTRGEHCKIQGDCWWLWVPYSDRASKGSTNLLWTAAPKLLVPSHVHASACPVENCLALDTIRRAVVRREWLVHILPQTGCSTGKARHPRKHHESCQQPHSDECLHP